MRKLEFVMKVKEFEKKKGKLFFLAKLGVMMGDYMFLFDHLNYFWYNPKDDDLYMTRIKPVEKQVEVRRAFWRANRCSKLCKGAKYSSNHLGEQHIYILTHLSLSLEDFLFFFVDWWRKKKQTQNLGRRQWLC